MKLSVIIPVYNEIGTIGKVLELVDGTPVDKEIIVVDDGSTDGTREFLLGLSSPHRNSSGNGDTRKFGVNGNGKLRLILMDKNSGKGSAIREGLKYVTGDLVITQDADLELDPGDYPALIEPILNGETQVVYGSRFLRPSKRPPFLIRLFNRCITAVTNVLFLSHLTDEATGYKVFRADVIKSIPLQCKRFEFCPEVTARLLRAGHRIVEVPVTYRPRTKREGKKLKWFDGIEALWTLVRFRFSRLS